MSGTLFIIPTPIGNLDDITLRSLEILKRVDAIASEDTRHSGQLLAHYNIKKPLISFHEHNENSRLHNLIDELLAGKSIALVSDAGTPTISDPGFKLIREAVRHGIEIDPLPGASSVLVALVGSGLPTDHFYFGGFLPKSNTKRKKSFEAVSLLPATLVYFESPYRIKSFLSDALEALGDRQVVIGRELTKRYQEYIRGTISEVLERVDSRPIKGEIVVVIDRHEITE